jgi:hypothetical protein
LQDRPVYLKQRYGRLEANVVYIRRGDTTEKAAPDEIARMGSSALLARAQPSVRVEFADISGRKKLGTKVQLESHSYDVPDRRTVSPSSAISASPSSRFSVASRFSCPRATNSRSMDPPFREAVAVDQPGQLSAI